MHRDISMFGNNPLPTNMRFPPPPPFFPIPPIANRSFPPPLAPPPPIVHQSSPPPWNNPYSQLTMIPQERNGFHRIPVGLSHNLPCIPQNIKTQEKTLKECDSEWIQNFLKRKVDELPHTKDRAVKLSEAKQLHSKAYKLLNAIQKSSESGTDAKTLLNSSIKKELDEILHVFNDDKYVARITTLVRKRKRKRERSKIRRQEDFKRKVEMQELIKEKHILVDKWLEDRKKVEDDLKRERKVRKDLDEYLSDVRQKQQNAQRHLNIFNAIAKLRKARCETAIRKGQPPPSETHNDVFKTAHKSACNRLRDFISECKTEENFMRKYLTEEHEAEERRIQEKLKEEKGKKVLEWKAERSQILFGPEDDLDSSNPMWPVQEIHCQGNRSLVELVNVRAQWDCFISDTGSSIPTRWVEPPLPSSDEWQSYMSTS